jgi:hypothetical protein
MIPGTPPISHRQKTAAIAVAGAVDFLQVVVFPFFGEGFFSPLEDALDFITAVVLMFICGFRWQFILAFLLELTPVMDLFPTWTAVVLLISTVPERVNVTPVPPRSEASKQGVAPVAEGKDFLEVDAIVVPMPAVSPANG